MTSNAICHNPNSTWTLNARGQDPCVQYAVLLASCDTNFIVAPMNATSTPYLPGIRTAACACNVVAYSLASACSWCQGTTGLLTHWITQAEWGRNCTTLGQTYLLDRLPGNSRPTSVVIPHWAYVPPSSGTWDPAQAQSVANTTTTASSTRVFTSPSAITASPTVSGSIASTHVPGSIFEDNKHIPGIVMISLVLIICFVVALVVVARKMRRCWGRRQPDPEKAAIVSRANSALKRVPPTLDMTTLRGLPRPVPIQADSFMTNSSPATSHILPSLPGYAADESNSPGTSNRHSCADTRVGSLGERSSYSSEACRYNLVKWVTTCGRRPEIIQDQPLHELLMALNPSLAAINQSMLSHDIHTVFEGAKKIVIQALQKHQGRLHISFDGWSAPSISSHVGIKAHWANHNCMVNVLLDIIPMDKGSDGVTLAHKAVSCLKEYGIEDRILGITCNSAPSNTVILDTLQSTLSNFRGRDSRSQCIWNSINHIVKAIISQFVSTTIKPGFIGMPKRPGVSPTSPSSSVNPTLQDANDEPKSPVTGAGVEGELIADQDAFDKRIIDAMNNRLYQEACETDPASDEVFLSAIDIKVGQDALSKAISIAQIIRDSPSLCSKLQSETTSDLSQLCNLTLTRWYSIVSAIGSLCSIRQPLGRICDTEQVPQLYDAYPTETEWEVLQQLSSLLELFDKAALLPAMEMPSVSDVFFIFGYFRSELESIMMDSSNHPSLRAAARRGLAIVQRYGTPSRVSALVRVATVLDPSVKIKGLRDDGWTESDIEQTLVLLRAIWEQDYKSTPQKAPSTESLSSRNISTFRNSRIHINGDELEEYLSSPPEYSKSNPTVYWSLREGALARMGRDFSSCPATSTDWESALSENRLIPLSTEHSLSDPKTRISAILGSWIRLPGLLSDDEMINVLKGMSTDVEI